MNFQHDYIVPTEFSSMDKVLCMRCETVIADSRYVEQERFNSKEKIAVYAPRKLGIYRQVPVEVDQAGRRSVMHVLVCEVCQTFELTEDIGEKILRQIERAQMLQLAWVGLPEEAQEAVKRKYAAMKIIRRLRGEELVGYYQKENKHAGDL